jgi:hypothetical protein
MKSKLLILLLLLLACLGLQAYTFGQNKVNVVSSDWSYIQTMHFDIYFPMGYNDFGRLAALMAEETYYTLRDNLRFPIDSRIPVIFYGSKSEFQNTNIIYPLLTEGVGGFTESLRNRVVVPFEGSYSKLEELLAHELTHAYVNAIDASGTGVLNALRPTSFPFWFSEGLPEYLSIGGEDNFNNMFILDMVVNDRLPGLETSEGFYAYRLGESFLTYIANQWGRDKVSEYFFAIRAARNVEEATQKIFGMKFEDLESRWRYQLKREYFPVVQTHGIPMEEFERRTFSDRDGSYFNYMPRFSPNGQRYVYFSDTGARYSVWLAGTYGLSSPRKLVTGESTGSMEEFYYFRATLAWFNDNIHVAFPAKSSSGDVIHILDTDKGKITRSIRIPALRAIYELDVSPDGKKILISGQADMQSDLYEYDIESAELRKLTDDLFFDTQPRYSPDGKYVVFASERFEDPSKTRKGFFSNYTAAIFRLDLGDLSLTQMSFEDSRCAFPLYDASGTKLLYLIESGGVSNYRVLDLAENKRASLSSTLSGIYSGDISPDGKYLVISNYFRNAWDIYMASAPLDSLVWEDCPAPEAYTSTANLMSGIDIRSLDLYGKRPLKKPKRVNPARDYDSRRPMIGEIPEFTYAAEDSLQLLRDFSYDDRPTKPSGTKPVVKKYRPKFALDSFWGGLAYSSSVGGIGYVELGLSDLMGNHGIGINASISGKLAESNVLLTYLYLKHRPDYGVGIFNLFDEIYYRETIPGPANDNYYRARERQSGLYLLYRYPFSRFFRVELDNMVYQRETGWDIWDWNDDGSDGEWVDANQNENAWVDSPGLTLVHDNALYGSTGPLVGWRGMYMLRATFADSELEYLTHYLDLRSYTLFSKRYAFALRAIGGYSSGDSPQYFDLEGYYGVRAYDSDLSGTKKALLSAELRFPFMEYIAMAFPLPITIPNIRGAMFMDIGTVFSEFDEFRGMRDGKLNDLKLSYGWGPRLNLGYVVLRLDIAWLSDLSKISKPSYFISLTEDF